MSSAASKRAVALADRRLLQDAAGLQVRDGFVGGLHAAIDERGGALHGDERRAGQRVDQPQHGGVRADLADRRPPARLDRVDLALVFVGVVDRAGQRSREQRDPAVEPSTASAASGSLRERVAVSPAM